MARRKFREVFGKKLLIGDGAMGTMLFKKGFQNERVPERLNLAHPEVIREIHREYIEAGAQIIETNTFGGNIFKIEDEELKKDIYRLNFEGARLAKKEAEAASKEVWVAGSMGPSGKLLYPEGDKTFEEISQAYAAQARALQEGGADFLILETFASLRELKAALSGVKSSVEIPVIAQLTFFDNGRSLSGATVEILAEVAEVMGADGVGINCSLGPKEIAPLIDRLVKATVLPVSVMPNAGIPQLIGDTTIYPLSPEDYLLEYLPMVESGVSLIGGCCGTDPRFIKLLSQKFSSHTINRPRVKKHFTMASGSRLVRGGNTEKVIFIGERINPTGRKKLARDIVERKFELVVKSAKKQIKHGAIALDINVGIPGEDEVELLTKASLTVGNLVNLPLSLDSNNPKALEETLKVLDGKPLINSMSGKRKEMETILPLAQKYGACVIALLLDEEGIPQTHQERIKIAEKIIDYAQNRGFPLYNIIFDPLTMTIATGDEAAVETLKTIEWLNSEGYYSILGLSNVSHGMPLRNVINSAFLSMATYVGLTAMIANPLDQIFISIYDASNIVAGRGQIRAFLTKYQGIKKLSLKEKNSKEEKPKAAEEGSRSSKNLSSIKSAIIEGNENNIIELLEKALAEGKSPFELVNEEMISAIREVGDLYDKGVYYLPQLIASARVMQKGFNYLKPLLKEESTAKQKKFLLLTVEGDVHDIGKNIVGLLLENYGYQVIDLGKDVKRDYFIENVKRHQPDYVGLSALMTTTMPNMAKFVKILKEMELSKKPLIFVGGACVTDKFAQDIGADYYTKDGMELVKLLEKLENEE